MELARYSRGHLFLAYDTLMSMETGTTSTVITIVAARGLALALLHGHGPRLSMLFAWLSWYAFLCLGRTDVAALARYRLACAASSARCNALDLFTDSSYSPSGVESATIPPPA